MQKQRTKKTILSICALLGSGSVLANQAPTLEPLNDVSVVVGEQVSMRIVPNDPEGIVPGVRVIDIPAGAMFSDNGDGTRTFKWLPQSHNMGQTKVTFEAVDARDQSLSNSRTVLINVMDSTQPPGNAGGNLAPEIESLVSQQITVGESFDFRVVPFDPEGVVPALRIDNQPNNARFDDNRDGTRQFRWTPSADETGDYNVSFVAYDENEPSLSTTQTITLSVKTRNVNNNPNPNNPVITGEGPGPKFVDLSDQFVYLGQTLEFVVRAKSEDGSVPGLALDRMPVDSSFVDNRDGTRTFRWLPYPVNLGDTYITVIAIDSKDPTIRTNQTVKIRVERDPNNPVNFRPVINGIQNPTIRAGDTLNQLVQPVDPDFTVPSLFALNLPNDAQFVDNGDGTRDFVWQTDAGDIGSHTYDFLVKDSEDPSLQFEKSFTVTVVEPSTFDRSGERLRQLAKDRDFLIGYAVRLKASGLADNQLYADIGSQEFNMVTPENSHKMGWIQPQRGVFKWEDADELAEFAIDKGMVLHGHPLVWYTQLPGWVQFMDPSEAKSIMNEHINALVNRYRGKVKVWDVVNEAINDVDGQLRKSVWYKGMGEGYIAEAYRTARAADPEAQLIYNEYDVAWYNTKSDGMYNLLKRELDAGTPIDGVGFQMHLRTSFDDFEGMRNNIQRFADLGLDIYITEFDVAMDAEGEEEIQANIYRKALEICLDQPKCKAMQSWGFTDRYSWRAGNKPLLLTDKYITKPAYHAWQQTLQYYGR